MNTFSISVFGQLADIVGGDRIVIPVCTNVVDLKVELFKSYPALSEKTFVVAIDHKIAEKDALLNTTSSIALLPPFSGG